MPAMVQMQVSQSNAYLELLARIEKRIESGETVTFKKATVRFPSL